MECVDDERPVPQQRPGSVRACSGPVGLRRLMPGCLKGTTVQPSLSLSEVAKVYCANREGQGKGRPRRPLERSRFYEFSSNWPRTGDGT
jgi:hypothetical protein